MKYIDLSFSVDGEEWVNLVESWDTEGSMTQIYVPHPEGPCCASPTGERPYHLHYEQLGPRYPLGTPVITVEHLEMVDAAYRKVAKEDTE